MHLSLLNFVLSGYLPTLSGSLSGAALPSNVSNFELWTWLPGSCNFSATHVGLVWLHRYFEMHESHATVKDRKCVLCPCPLRHVSSWKAIRLKKCSFPFLDPFWLFPSFPVDRMFEGGFQKNLLHGQWVYAAVPACSFLDPPCSSSRTQTWLLSLTSHQEPPQVAVTIQRW